MSLKYANNVRLYDWVCHMFSQINVQPVYTEKCRCKLSQLIVNEGPHSAVQKLRDKGFDCVFGGIDLSIQYTCVSQLGYSADAAI